MCQGGNGILKVPSPEKKSVLFTVKLDFDFPLPPPLLQHSDNNLSQLPDTNLGDGLEVAISHFPNYGQDGKTHSIVANSYMYDQLMVQLMDSYYVNCQQMFNRSC